MVIQSLRVAIFCFEDYYGLFSWIRDPLLSDCCITIIVKNRAAQPGRIQLPILWGPKLLLALQFLKGMETYNVFPHVYGTLFIYLYYPEILDTWSLCHSSLYIDVAQGIFSLSLVSYINSFLIYSPVWLSWNSMKRINIAHSSHQPPEPQPGLMWLVKGTASFSW